jgi:methyltransferase-like protein
MAFYLPGARFVGIDLSRQQVETGTRFIAELGLPNVELLHRDVADGVADLGQFDYIIVHGLYSWVAAPIRQKILELCARQLAPRGIAYISFNTLPGWRTRSMARDMLLHHTRGTTAPRARLMLAYQFIEQYGAAFASAKTRDAALIADELDYLRRAPPSYLYHEYLEETNEALLFADFVAQAQAAELQYVADAELATMLPGTLPEAARDEVAQIEDPLVREQYMDFLRCRRFRRTLLTHAGATVKAAPDMAVFRSLALYADLSSQEEIDLGSTQPQDFFTGTGARFALSHPLAKAAAMLLSARFPGSVAYEELAIAAAQAVRDYGDAALADAREALQTELFSLAAYQALRLTLHPQSLAHELPAQPQAHALARYQAQQEQPPAGVRHTAVDLDEHAARLLSLADGSRTLDELAAAMQSGLTDNTAGNVAVRSEELLWTFARNGLLQAQGAR